MQLTCNVLHVEDDATKVHDYIVDICKNQGINQANIDKMIPAEDEIKDDLKKEGTALEIIPGYWWAATLREAVECIDRFTSNHRFFDFVVIDRRLSDTELPVHEKNQMNNPSEYDLNKKYLNEAFPWYSHQAAFTGDFLFFYLTLIDKIYLRNIYFFTGQDIDEKQDIEESKDKSIIKVWYKIAQETMEKDNYDAFDMWCKEHYIKKAGHNLEEEAKARAHLIKMMSLPNAGICHQFREGLKVFDYIDNNQSPIISLKYKDNILNLLMAAKQYDGTAINSEDLEELRNGLGELLDILSHDVLGVHAEYIPTYYDKKTQSYYPGDPLVILDENNNYKPYNVSKALLQEARKPGKKYLERVSYLINLIYHIQSEGIHGGIQKKSKPLSNIYLLHTCVFAFLELSRIIVDIISKNTNQYHLV